MLTPPISLELLWDYQRIGIDRESRLFIPHKTTVYRRRFMIKTLTNQRIIVFLQQKELSSLFPFKRSLTRTLKAGAKVLICQILIMTCIAYIVYELCSVGRKSVKCK